MVSGYKGERKMECKDILNLIGIRDESVQDSEMNTLCFFAICFDSGMTGADVKYGGCRYFV